MFTYWKSQSFRTLNHWQSVKPQAVIEKDLIDYIKAEDWYNGIHSGGTDYFMPLSLKPTDTFLDDLQVASHLSGSSLLPGYVGSELVNLDTSGDYTPAAIYSTKYDFDDNSAFWCYALDFGESTYEPIVQTTDGVGDLYFSIPNNGAWETKIISPDPAGYYYGDIFVPRVRNVLFVFCGIFNKAYSSSLVLPSWMTEPTGEWKTGLTRYTPISGDMANSSFYSMWLLSEEVRKAMSLCFCQTYEQWKPEISFPSSYEKLAYETASPNYVNICYGFNTGGLTEEGTSGTYNRIMQMSRNFTWEGYAGYLSAPMYIPYKKTGEYYQGYVGGITYSTNTDNFARGLTSGFNFSDSDSTNILHPLVSYFNDPINSALQESNALYTTPAYQYFRNGGEPGSNLTLSGDYYADNQYILYGNMYHIPVGYKLIDHALLAQKETA